MGNMAETKDKMYSPEALLHLLPGSCSPGPRQFCGVSGLIHCKVSILKAQNFSIALQVRDQDFSTVSSGLSSAIEGLPSALEN